MSWHNICNPFGTELVRANNEGIAKIYITGHFLGHPLMMTCGLPSQSIILLWRHIGHDGVSNHQPHNYLLNRLFRCRSNRTSKLRVTGLCEGNSSVTGEFLEQGASNAENVSIWWRHHGMEKRFQDVTSSWTLGGYTLKMFFLLASTLWIAFKWFEYFFGIHIDVCFYN